MNWNILSLPVIYFAGYLVSVFLILIFLYYQEGEITLRDLFLALMVSLLSWTVPLALFISFILEEGDKVILLRKPQKHPPGNENTKRERSVA